MAAQWKYVLRRAWFPRALGETDEIHKKKGGRQGKRERNERKEFYEKTRNDERSNDRKRNDGTRRESEERETRVMAGAAAP